MPDISLPLARSKESDAFVVTVFGQEMNGLDQGDEISSWLTQFIGVSLRLVRYPENHARVVDPKERSDADASIAYVDQYPYLVANQATLEQVRAATINELGEENAVTIRNFRPNILIEGKESKAWDELLYDKVHFGTSTLNLEQNCIRCKLTTVVPHKGVFGGQQPLKYLTAEKGTTFGMHAVHTKGSIGKVIKVGDKVVVETFRDKPNSPLETN